MNDVIIGFADTIVHVCDLKKLKAASAFSNHLVYKEQQSEVLLP
jgi:hypothetical protein